MSIEKRNHFQRAIKIVTKLFIDDIQIKLEKKPKKRRTKTMDCQKTPFWSI